jgi:hypothetical protein
MNRRPGRRWEAGRTSLADLAAATTARKALLHDKALSTFQIAVAGTAPVGGQSRCDSASRPAQC